MQEFEVTFTLTLTLTGRLVIEARNEESAENKADKMTENFGLLQWTWGKVPKAWEDAEWDEDDISIDVEFIDEVY